MKIIFRPLEKQDFKQFAEWLSRPHVQRWWREPATVEHVAKDYGACTDGDYRTRVYVVQAGDKPIGIIQAYRWSDYPDDTDWLPGPGLVGIDYLIGEEAYTGQGYGTQMIRDFVEQIVKPLYPEASGIATSAEVANPASLGALARAGFTPGEIITGEYGTPERVMVQWFGREAGR